MMMRAMTTKAATTRAVMTTTKAGTKRAVSIARRATEEETGEQMNQQMEGGEIGLGGLEDMMDKADGGATPDFVKSLGVKELDDVFAILGSQTKGAELGQLVLSEKFGEVLFRESGFTSTAETINGRCAVRVVSRRLVDCFVFFFVFVGFFSCWRPRVSSDGVGIDARKRGLGDKRRARLYEGRRERANERLYESVCARTRGLTDAGWMIFHARFR